MLIPTTFVEDNPESHNLVKLVFLVATSVSTAMQEVAWHTVFPINKIANSHRSQPYIQIAMYL